MTKFKSNLVPHQKAASNTILVEKIIGDKETFLPTYYFVISLHLLNTYRKCIKLVLVSLAYKDSIEEIKNQK